MRRKKDKSNGITALYERLSRDDDNAGESNEESTLRSKVHGRNALSVFAHWAQGTAKMKSRQSSPEKQNTAHIRSSRQKNSRSTC